MKINCLLAVFILFWIVFVSLSFFFFNQANKYCDHFESRSNFLCLNSSLTLFIPLTHWSSKQGMITICFSPVSIFIMKKGFVRIGLILATINILLFQTINLCTLNLITPSFSSSTTRIIFSFSVSAITTLFEFSSAKIKCLSLGLFSTTTNALISFHMNG